jgi:ketosteroid isomerase-like protein
MTQELRDFETFMRRRESIAGSYVNGDTSPLREIITGQSPATFFGPKGGFNAGAKEVAANYDESAKSFGPGGNNRFEILHMAADGGLAYWVGFQRATSRMRGMSEPVQFDLRITEIFRREGSEWKLIHRHADPLANEGNTK